MFSKEDIARLAKRSADQHRGVEAGWISFRLHVVDPTTDLETVDDMKLAFFAGATRMFDTLVQMIYDKKHRPHGDAPANLQRIQSELQDYADDIDCSG
jgi:hypothetical protein